MNYSRRIDPTEKGLSAQAVGKTYKKRPVVQNVSINVRRGEAVGGVGPHRARQTTPP